jgi:acetyl esterase/lipase
MMEDINLVIDDLKLNASEYKIDPNHIQLVGESGGGHIVMYYGINEKARPEVKSVVSMFGPTNLDAQDFKEIINAVPLLTAAPPNYFLRKAEDCTSVTNKQVRTWSSYKSFSDHNDISVTQPNDFLDTLSTTFSPNMSNDIAMFITHGENDELVPFSQAESMMTAMQNKFGTVNCEESDFSCHLKLGAYPDCGHGWIGGNCQRQMLISDIVNWLVEH